MKKLLLDCGGLLAALKPLDFEFEAEEDEVHSGRLLSDLLNSSRSDVTSQPYPLYFSLLLGCLSALTGVVDGRLIEKKPPPASNGGRVSPPPTKKPRLADSCPYESSDFNLVLQLDDGSRVPANREAVAGSDGSDRAGSEYFRALLRGGFGEALGGVEEAIRIKDVSAGMLLPLLHYLHGCRFGSDGEAEKGNVQEARGQCLTLESLLIHGLGVFRNGSDEISIEGFQKTQLGETMVGACRFLVNDLQRELEDIFVSFLLSCSSGAPPNQTHKENNAVKTEKVPKSSDPVEESLANLTSELELTAQATKLLQQVKDGETSVSGTIEKVITGLSRGLDGSTITKHISGSKSVRASEVLLGSAEEELSEPKNRLKDADREACCSSDTTLAALLPHLYWFSQRYSYPALGRACLALLLGFQDSPSPFASTSVASDVLRRVAREADCTDTLKRDLLSLVSAALG